MQPAMEAQIIQQVVGRERWDEPSTEGYGNQPSADVIWSKRITQERSGKLPLELDNHAVVAPKQ